MSTLVTLCVHVYHLAVVNAKKKKNHIQPEGFRVYKTFGAKVSGHIFKTYINLQGSANTGHLRYLQEKKK